MTMTSDEIRLKAIVAEAVAEAVDTEHGAEYPSPKCINWVVREIQPLKDQLRDMQTIKSTLTLVLRTLWALGGSLAGAVWWAITR